MKVKEAPPTRSSMPQPWTERMRPARARGHCMQAWALVVGTLKQRHTGSPIPELTLAQSREHQRSERAERRLLDEKEAG